jgi:predicted Rdx family selenoprotein
LSALDATGVMIEPQTFAALMQGLGHAFGKKIERETMMEYYQVLGNVDLEKLKSAVQWVKENVDGGFPRIATLKQRLEAERHVDDLTSRAGTPLRHRVEPAMVFAVCPTCGCSFAVMRTQLRDDAARGTVYRCPNGRHWECPATLSATDILRKETQ